MNNTMQMLRARASGYGIPYVDGPPSALNDVQPGIARGVIVSVGSAERYRAADGDMVTSGTVAVVILALIALGLVGFNVSTRAFQA